MQVARETGYLDGVQDFLSAESYGYLPPDKVVALCTGSQGEPRAALSRIARDEHPEVTLAKGDRVIFSARPIPGNEKAISGVINGLVRQGVEVITDRTHLVHVSGHPRRDEMRDMYGWVRPQIALPVHGEALHLAEHAKLARAAGVKDVILCANGDLVRLAPGPTGVIDEVRAGRLYKDRDGGDRPRPKGRHGRQPGGVPDWHPAAERRRRQHRSHCRRRRDRHHRATAEGAAARSGIGGGSGARSGTLGHRGQLGQEAAMPRARAHRIEDDAAG